MAQAPVLVERRGRVVLITLNRPDRRNAVDSGLANALASALDVLDTTHDVRVGVLRGAGTGFCAGMDLKAFALGDRPFVEGRGFAGIAERAAEKPVIAAIEGFAVAGGLEIALACDLIVAADDAKLGIPEVKRGLAAAGGALLRLPERIPYHVAMELALTGELLDPRRAAGLGLVNRLTDPGDALPTALAMADEIAANAPLALAVSKRILLEAPGWPREQRWTRQRAILDPVLASADAREGALAFGERRRPSWAGR